MKTIVTACAVLALVVAGGTATARNDRPTIAVAAFTNQTSNSNWWSSDVGEQLGDVLSNELSSSGHFTVVERAKVDAVLAEQDFASSGRVRAGSGPATGNITGARYLVTGVVSAYNEDTSNTGGGLSFRGVRVGGGKSEAYVAIDLRVIDSETSEVVASRTVEGRSTSSGINVGAFRHGLGGNFSHENNVPAGKAVRAALVEATDYLDCAMVLRNNCMASYNAKENRRKDSNRKLLNLD